MTKSILFSIALILFTPLAFAEVDCDALHIRASDHGEIVGDVGSGRDIIGRGRLQFYAAPDLRCKIDGLFVVPGDVLFAQREYKGFTLVAFIAMKKTDKKDVVGWVQSSRLRENDKGILPGAHAF